MKQQQARISFFFVTIAGVFSANAILFACSSSDSTSPAPVEAGVDATAPRRDAPALDDSASDDAAPACSPHAVGC